MYIFGTDFDDTLYFHGGVGIRQEDVDAIKKFQEGGDQFGLVSGRARVMWPLLEEMTQGRVDFDFKVFSNGACICDKDNNILKEWFLPEKIVRELYDKYRDAGLIFHGQNEIYLTKAKRSVPGTVIASIDEMDPAKIYAISYSHLTPEGQKVYQENLGRDDVIMVSNSRFTDFGPLNVSKGRGLNYIAHELYGNGDISAAVGDSYNDQSMLEDADISFTFHTSPEDVQNAADYLVNSVSEAIDCLEKTKIDQQ